MAAPSSRPKARATALTGTPGVGKSAVARAIAPRLRSIEVGELAVRLGVGRGRGRSVEVDLPRLRSEVLRNRVLERYDLLVGHLAHLLPVRRAIVLRCHPLELRERLRRARRGTPGERQANLVSEATDTILIEAAATRMPIAEIDTTGRTIDGVARSVVVRWRVPRWRRGKPVDWLADPEITEHLLDGPP